MRDGLRKSRSKHISGSHAFGRNPQNRLCEPIHGMGRGLERDRVRSVGTTWNQDFYGLPHVEQPSQPIVCTVNSELWRNPRECFQSRLGRLSMARISAVAEQ